MKEEEKKKNSGLINVSKVGWSVYILREKSIKKRKVMKENPRHHLLLRWAHQLYNSKNSDSTTSKRKKDAVRTPR